MRRSPIMERFGLRRRASGQQRLRHAGLAIEQLEDRCLLTAYNLLVSTYTPTGQINDAGGSSVLEYSEATNMPLLGGVYTGDHGLTTATGLAVAPDGSYYVSSDGSGPMVDGFATGQVLHYSSSGVFLNVLGANDANPATLYVPGTLAFGPNGNLYVADLGAGAIYQFDTSSTTQQYQAADTLWLPGVTTIDMGVPNVGQFVPAGLTFAADATHDVIVSDYQTGEIAQFNLAQYDATGAYTTLIAPDTVGPNGTTGANPIFAIAMLEMSNGDLLIADSDSGNDPTGHHQILEYNPATPNTLMTYINLTTPVGTSQYDDAGLPPQPSAMLLDADGNLLVGLGPSRAGDGAVEKFNIQDQTPTLMETIASGLGAPSGLGLEPVTPSDIIFSTYVDTNGSSVLRYNDATQLPVPGGAATNAGANSSGYPGLGVASGIAVAPDGSYYVSSDATSQVLHFSNSGQLLGALGANDKDPVTLYAPGTLAFGPDGNLYVADLEAGAIYQFDVNSTTQQYLAADTLWLPTVTTTDDGVQSNSQFSPTGLTFAADGTHDLIVSDYQTGEIAEFNPAVYVYNDASTYTTLVAPDTVSPNSTSGNPIFAIAMLELSNGDLLIADSNPGNDPAEHHQILEYNPATQGLTLVANLTDPEDQSGDPAQPVSMALDADGNLLVGVAPDETDDGAVQKFDLSTDPTTGNLTATLAETIASGVGDPSGIALVPSQVNDVLVGNLMDGVLRYSSADQPLSSGDSSPVATSPPPTAGVAVAPDGSYYVSSIGTGPEVYGEATGQILHYSNSGEYLGVLGANDTTQATLFYPGSLAFGPDGNLYVADLGAGVIDQFDVNPSDQQWQPDDTIVLPSVTLPNGTVDPFMPAGMTFASNSTRDPIVGDLETGEVVQCNADGSFTTLIAPDVPSPNGMSGEPISPLAMQELSNGDLLIADSTLGGDPADHHQVLEYNSNMDLIATINLTSPVDSYGDLPQPTSLQLTPNGNLLVGMSPNEYYPDGAVEEYDLSNQQLISTVASSIGAPAGLALVPPNVMPVPATVWTNADDTNIGLTIAQTDDGNVHVYQTGSATDVVSPQAASGVGEIRISGSDNATNALTIDFGGGDPIPADGIVFDGAAGTAINTVSVDDSTGSDAYSLAGSQLDINGGPAVTMTNAQLAALDFGGGSLTIQSGTLSTDLSGAGGVIKSGSGTVTLSGSNSYGGSTTVTAGTLIVADSNALPGGTVLTIGSDADWGSAASPVAASTTGATPAAAGAASSSASASPAQSTVSAAPLAAASLATMPPNLPAASPAEASSVLPSNAASDTFWKSYPPAPGPAAAHVASAAGDLAWWNSPGSSNSNGTSTNDNRRIAALDALWSQYGRA